MIRYCFTWFASYLTTTNYYYFLFYLIIINRIVSASGPWIEELSNWIILISCAKAQFIDELEKQKIKEEKWKKQWQQWKFRTKFLSKLCWPKAMFIDKQKKKEEKNHIEIQLSAELRSDSFVHCERIENETTDGKLFGCWYGPTSINRLWRGGYLWWQFSGLVESLSSNT